MPHTLDNRSSPLLILRSFLAIFLLRWSIGMLLRVAVSNRRS
jgi:hypothetical protein